MTAPDQTGADRSEAELVAEAVSAVPGVFGLHAGAVGEAVTLLPGRRVAGVRVTPEVGEVHIAVEHGESVRDVAEAVRHAAHAVLDRPVTVFVEDVTTPEPPPPAPSPADADRPITDTPDTTTTAPTGAEERN